MSFAGREVLSRGSEKGFLEGVLGRGLPEGTHKAETPPFVEYDPQVHALQECVCVVEATRGGRLSTETPCGVTQGCGHMLAGAYMLEIASKLMQNH